MSVTRYPSSHKQVAAWQTQKRGNLHAVERLARKFGLISLLIKTFTKLREMKGKASSIFCPEWPAAGCCMKEVLPVVGTIRSWPGAGAVPRAGCELQLLGRLSRVWGRRTAWHLPAAYQSILLRKSTILLFLLQVYTDRVSQNNTEWWLTSYYVAKIDYCIEFPPF